MNNFTFYSPTEFVFGKQTEQRCGELCKKYGARKVLVVYGGGSAVRSGLLAKVEESLKGVGIEYVKLGGIRPNPTDDKVYEGIELVRNNDVDFVLAVGGGSVIDTAKAVCIGVPYDGDFWDFYIGKAKIENALPVASILTIPAAGSEGSGNSVITNSKTLQKLGVKSPMLLRPRFAIMNPELTMTLPAWQTASGIADMMAHILERYLTNTRDVIISDRLAEGALLGIMDAAERVMSNPDDYEARANIMWSGTIAHNDTCSAGREEDWSTHALEHEISALYDVTHGAGLTVMFPAYMLYALEENPRKIAQMAMRVMRVTAPDSNSYDTDVDTLPIDQQKEIAREGVLRLRAWFHDILQLPVSFKKLGVENPDIDLMVKNVHKNKGEVFGFYIKLDETKSKAIYNLAL